MAKGFRRRHFLVGGLQYRMLALSLGHLVVFAVLVSVALFAPLMIQLENPGLEPEVQRRIATEFLYLHSRFWPTLGLIFLCLGCHSVLVTHRIAGPLIGFRRVLASVGVGDLSVRARMRRHDYLAQEEAAINAMIGGLRERMERVQEEYGAALAACAAVRRSVGQGGSPATLEDLEARMAALRAALGAFTLPSRATEDAEEPA